MSWIPRPDTEVRFMAKFVENRPLRSCRKVASRSAGLVPAPVLPKIGRSRPKFSEHCHLFICPRIPNLVRISCALPHLFRKDWFFGPKSHYNNPCGPHGTQTIHWYACCHGTAFSLHLERQTLHYHSHAALHRNVAIFELVRVFNHIFNCSCKNFIDISVQVLSSFTDTYTHKLTHTLLETIPLSLRYRWASGNKPRSLQAPYGF